MKTQNTPDKHTIVATDELIPIITSLLDVVGPPLWAEDPNLVDTPARVARMYRELLTPEAFNPTTFPNDPQNGYDQVVLVKDVVFHSLCAHHLLPFSGRVAIAYIPYATVIGLSKLVRIVEHYSRMLQIQESLTQDIGDYLVELLHPRGVAVIVEAAHLCMRMRGVRSPDSVAATSFMWGAFRERPEARAELMQLLYGGTR